MVMLLVMVMVVENINHQRVGTISVRRVGTINAKRRVGIISVWELGTCDKDTRVGIIHRRSLRPHNIWICALMYSSLCQQCAYVSPHHLFFLLLRRRRCGMGA